MISLYYSPENAYARYGVDHFIERSGIPFERMDPLTSGPLLTYGSGTTNNFSITLKTNEIRSAICGTVSSGSTRAGLCEIPTDTGRGTEVLGYFEGPGCRFPCVTRRDGGIDIGIDIFSETGSLLSGHLDRIWASLDETVRAGVASVPIVDFLEDLLVASVLKGCEELQIPLVRKTFWPGGKRFAVCLTHDVDEVKKTYQWITRPVRSLIQFDGAAFIGQVRSFVHKLGGREPYWTFDEIAAIEEHYHATSTFFFLKESGKSSLVSPKTWNLYGRSHSFQDAEVKRAIDYVHSRGNEVAIHGSFYSYGSGALIESETRELENVLKQKVTGVRQHHLNLSVPDTWKHQIRAGLVYDSSLGYKDRIGFRWGTSFPFFPLCETVPLPLLEIPLIIMDICLLDRPDPIADSFAIADQVEQHQGVLTLLWHPPVFNSDEVPRAKDLYHAIIGRSQARGAWVTHAQAITEWQKFRARASFSIRIEGASVIIYPHRPEYAYDVSIYIPRCTQIAQVSGDAIILERKNDTLHPELECLTIRITVSASEREIIVKFL